MRLFISRLNLCALICKFMNSVWSNTLKYQRFTPSGCKDKWIRIFEFVARTQFLLIIFTCGRVGQQSGTAEWGSRYHLQRRSQSRHINSNVYWDAQAAVVHFNFRAGSIFPVPVCTVPHKQNRQSTRASRCNKVDAVRLYASCRLNLLFPKGQKCMDALFNENQNCKVCFLGSF